MEVNIKDHIKYWWAFLLRGLLFMLLGTYMLSAPARSYVALSLFFGVVVLIAGVIELLHVFSNRRADGRWWRIIAGLIDVVLGIILVSHVVVSMSVLPFFLASWFLVRGIALFSFAASTRHPAWLIAGGALTVLFALLVMFNPVLGAMTIVAWTAVAFIVTGLFNGLLAFRLKDANDYFNRHSD
ncbi:MAG TPA: DUF308 domain-containing protein [Pedobacter sp.]